jgi:hypothetical protein
LMNPLLSGCGSWAPGQNFDKYSLMGSVLHWMNLNYKNSDNYLTPVLTRGMEYWIDIVGFQTSAEPSGTTPAVTLEWIIFYDPNPGGEGAGIVAGTVWFGNNLYWGVPLNKPASTLNDQFIAIYEPPPIRFKPIVPKWIRKGPIWPEERMLRSVRQWFDDFRQIKPSGGLFRPLAEVPEVEKMVLVKAADYSYYLVLFRNSRIAAIFNAYNGRFEELRIFDKPRLFAGDSGALSKLLKEKVSPGKAQIEKSAVTEIFYDSKSAAAGRFSPTVKADVLVKNADGATVPVKVILSSEGRVLKGLEAFEKKGGIR